MAIILIVASVGYYLITKSPDVEHQAISTNISDETKQRAEEKIEGFTVQLLTAPKDEILSLTLTDEEITSAVLKKLETSSEKLPLDLQNPSIAFIDDKILVFGDVSVSGFNTTIAIEVLAEAQDDQLKLTVERLNFGRLLLPDAILSKVTENLIPDKEILIDMNTLDIPIDLKKISVGDGQIVIAGLAR